MASRPSARTIIRALMAGKSVTGGGLYGEKAASRCGDPVGDRAVLVDAVEAGVLADQPLPVVGAARVAVADAGHRPGDRDLVLPGRVGAQGATARLHHGRQRGGGGEVDQTRDAAGVPALAEQAAGAHEDLGAAGGEEARDVPDPLTRRPATLEAEGGVVGPGGSVAPAGPAPRAVGTATGPSSATMRSVAAVSGSVSRTSSRSARERRVRRRRPCCR